MFSLRIVSPLAIIVRVLTDHGKQILTLALFDRSFSSSNGCLFLVDKGLSEMKSVVDVVRMIITACEQRWGGENDDDPRISSISTIFQYQTINQV